MTTHPEIEILQRRLLEVFQDQRDYLAMKPDAFLEELQHRADEQRFSEEFTVRTAAEINRAACLMILEERAKSS